MTRSFEISLRALLSAGLISLASPPGVQAASDTEELARQFLVLLDERDYGSAWRALDPSYREALSQDHWTKSVRSRRSELGSAQTRSLSFRQMMNEVPWRGPGTFMVLIFHGRFESRKNERVREVVVLEVRGSRWGIVGYSFDSPSAGASSPG